MSINMSVQMCSRTNTVPKQEIRCCAFASIFGLAWGAFFLVLGVTYTSSVGMREVCLVLSCVLLAVSTVIFIFSLVELIKNEMCCFQKDFLTCDIENISTEEQFELTDPISSNILNSPELSLQQIQENSPVISEAYSNVFFPCSSMSSPITNHTEKDSQGFVSQPEETYTLPYECELSLLNLRANNGLNNPNLVQKLKAHDSCLPSKNTVTFEESCLSNDVLYCEDGKTSGISKYPYMPTAEASNDKKEATALYENIQFLTHADETRSKDVCASRSPVGGFNAKDILGNKTLEQLNTCGIPIRRNCDIDANDGNTTSELLGASGKSSPRYIDMNLKVETTTPEELVVPGKSSPTYANLRPMAENTSPAELVVIGRSSPTYVNVRPRIENNSKDVSDKDVYMPRHIKESPISKNISEEKCSSSESIKSILV